MHLCIERQFGNKLKKIKKKNLKIFQIECQNFGLIKQNLKRLASGKKMRNPKVQKSMASKIKIKK